MRLTDAGKLTLGVIWDGQRVVETDVRSTRPLAALVLQGKTPAQVLQLVPMLFNVCGRAQGAAASAALQVAHGSSDTIVAAEQMIACEAVQEHLWRLMLDWPKLLGLSVQEQRFAAWYSLLRKVAAGEAEMAMFQQEFEREMLGMPLAAWQEIGSYPALQDWCRTSDRPLAQLLAQLDRTARHDAGESRLLPAWSAAEAQHACAGKWDSAFAAWPYWQGAAAETGAWSYHAENPLLCDMWRQGRSRVLIRLLARVCDVVEMASGRAVQRLAAASPTVGEGVAVVRTARGLLMHHVTLAAERVADYAIVAPTEWNFHPAGAFAQDMCGLQEGDRERLQQLARIEALSLDPCVPYEVEVRHA